MFHCFYSEVQVFNIKYMMMEILQAEILVFLSLFTREKFETIKLC